MPDSILNYERRYACVMEKLKESALSRQDKTIVCRFVDKCFTQGLSKGRVIKYVYYLIRLGTWLECHFEKASTPEIKRLVRKIETSSYAPPSKTEYKICVRKFYKWLRGTEESPPEVRWIKLHTNRVPRMKLPEELLTQEDIAKLINASQSRRNRAFVACLYETGCRIGELLFLRIKHAVVDQYGAQLRVSGKTGARRLRIVFSVPYLTAWLNRHPQKDDPGTYIWCNSKGRVMSYGGMRSMLYRLGRRAEVKKALNPHMFRHSRATHLANHLTEAQMKEYFGWVQASDMASVYVHLSGRDVDHAILKLYGITDNETEKDGQTLKPKQCPRCRMENPVTNRFCSLCGMVLDGQTMIGNVQKDLERKKADAVLDELVEDPEFRSVLIRKIKGLKRQKTTNK